ncbi:MAG: 3-deoxy-7-phosphoheptulonate synthase, partial [Calditrichales bacterium]
RPNGFNGIGEQGLPWLQRVKTEFNLPVATEVATPQHVELCLAHDIDILWIGARTAVNPFSVAEIASALQGVDITVMVKNPVNPDINTWLGSLERIAAAGIERLAAIHRGFSISEKSPYRNSPRWEIPFELKQRFSEMPIICDPSHIAGNRQWIAEISQTAMDLRMNGLMIEVHPDPDSAWSDAFQQITSQSLESILGQLDFHTDDSGRLKEEQVLNALRKEIDNADNSLMEIISRRYEISRKIGQYKKEKNMTVVQTQRWEHVLNDRLGQAREMGLDEEMIKSIYEILHARSITVQNDVIEKRY